MLCADCGMDVIELVTCDVCGKKVCPPCFAEAHDGITLAFDLVESSVDAVQVSEQSTEFS